MSLITKYNYEAYLLDYVEENLSPELVAELMLFLEQNPHFKEDLEGFENYKLSPEVSPFFDKSTLIKDASLITLSNYEDFIIAEIEGENSIESSTALQLFLSQNPEKKEDLTAYQNTRLVGETVLFKNKKAIKKKAGVVIFMNWMSSSAAAVIIVLLTLNWFSKKEAVYTPLSNKIESNKSIENFDENVLANFIIREEIEPEKLNQENKVVNKEIEQVSDLNNENQYANLPKEKVLDKVNEVEENEVQKEVVEIKEEILVAENNVTITYEDEFLDNGTSTPVKRKITKLDLIREAVKHKLNGNLDKGKEKVLFAINTKPLNFLRKNKNK